jgi:AraC-like DNA-binding protein
MRTASPSQFQKHSRLQEARRLMLGEGLDAAGAGYRVGYGDASHFTREYKRLFGAPPSRLVCASVGARPQSTARHGRSARSWLRSIVTLAVVDSFRSRW